MSIKEDQGPALGYTELQNMTLRRRSIDIHKLSAIAQMRSKPFQCGISNSNDEKGFESNYSVICCENNCDIIMDTD